MEGGGEGSVWLRTTITDRLRSGRQCSPADCCDQSLPVLEPGRAVIWTGLSERENVNGSSVIYGALPCAPTLPRARTLRVVEV